MDADVIFCVIIGNVKIIEKKLVELEACGQGQSYVLNVK